MHDVLLWRLLQDEPPCPDALAPQLRALAERPLDERVPFLGLLPRLLDAADAGLRALAVRALGGGTGLATFRLLVAALGDAEPAVRSAAVDSVADALAEHLDLTAVERLIALGAVPVVGGRT